MESRSVEIYFFSAVLVGALAVTFLIFLPYLSTVTVAATVALAFQPLHRKIVAAVRRSDGFNAFVTVIVVLLIVLIPLGFFGYRVVQEAFQVYIRLSNDGNEIPDQVSRIVGSRLPNVAAEEISQGIARYGRGFVQWIFNNLGNFFSGLAQTFADVFLGLIALYYFFKDGARIRAALVKRLPLSERYAEEILEKLHAAVNSVVQGSLVVAVAQGVCATIGFFIFGIPNAALWGSLTIVAALIPVIGTTITVLPAVSYLIITGSTIDAVALAAWGTVIVGLVDNVLRPQFLKKGVRVHPLLILLSVFGGIPVFGPIGFILGPIIVSLLFALLDIYPHFVFGKSDRRHA